MGHRTYSSGVGFTQYLELNTRGRCHQSKTLQGENSEVYIMPKRNQDL